MALSYKYFVGYLWLFKTAAQRHSIELINFWSCSVFIMWYHEKIIHSINSLLLDVRIRCNSFFQTEPQMFYGVQVCAYSLPSQHLYVIIREPLFAYSCSVEGSWILLLKETGYYLEKRSQIEGRNFSFRMLSMYFLLSMLFMTRNKPTVSADIHT